MSDDHLLPSNATGLERALSLAIDATPRVGLPIVEMRGLKLRQPPPSFLPYLLYEYGLGPISRFFDDPRECIADGIAWQRVRGTQDAITRALGWLGYDGAHENMPPRRRRWTLFMLAMDRLRDAEEPDLDDIEYLAQLSVAERSRFWRGFKDYDVRPVDYGHSAWSGSIWSEYSGARIREDGAKWSFGRVHERDYTLSQADLEALDVWLDEDSGGLSWGNFPWTSEGVTWNSAPFATRAQLMAAGVLAKRCWIRFRDADGAIIGHRRARAFRPVIEDPHGVYACGALNYAPQGSSPILYVEALTDFGDGFGSTAASWSLLFAPTSVAPIKPGVLWADPAELSGGVEIMPTAATIPFGRTVRERARAILRFQTP